LGEAPPADVRVDAGLLRRLLRAQHPDLAGLDIAPFAEGWDNVLLRLGDDLLVRLPRRAASAPLIERELSWLPRLAPHLPLPIPVPVRAGRPGEGYPWSWTIVPWLEGVSAVEGDLDPVEAAPALGRFVRALHGIEASNDAPENPYHGVPPRARTEAFLERLHGLRDLLDAPRLEAVWLEASSAPDWAGRRIICHGDLHPFNLLVREGRLAAVLDWGDLHAGDPARDLASAYLALPADEHERFFETYGPVDEATGRRARAWALFIGLVFFDPGEGDPDAPSREIGRRALASVLA
jgi:aminoglycoside phosphotransferase (APT) family kinase protein